VKEIVGSTSTIHGANEMRRVMSLEISIDEFRKATEVILCRIEERGHRTVDIDVDFYWAVPKKHRYDPYKQPSELTMGQLTEDWRELQGISTGTREPAGYALTWLPAVAVALGERAVE
jgi:hypothetical protein